MLEKITKSKGGGELAYIHINKELRYFKNRSIGLATHVILYRFHETSSNVSMIIRVNLGYHWYQK
jgi:hypothetical protein